MTWASLCSLDFLRSAWEASICSVQVPIVWAGQALRSQHSVMGGSPDGRADPGGLQPEVLV